MHLLSTISLFLLTLASSFAQAQTSSATTTTTITSTSTLTITRTLVLASQTTTVTLSTGAANLTGVAPVHSSSGYQTPTGAITQGMAGAATGAGPASTSLSPYQALGAGSSLDGQAAVYAAAGAMAFAVVAGLA